MNRVSIKPVEIRMLTVDSDFELGCFDLESFGDAPC